MNSITPHEFVPPQTTAAVNSSVLGKCLNFCGAAMHGLSTGIKQVAASCTNCAYATLKNSGVSADSVYGWEMLDETSSAKGHHSLPLRTWKRHSAVLTLAQEVSAQQHGQDVNAQQ